MCALAVETVRETEQAPHGSADRRATLMVADGTCFEGQGLGPAGIVGGELVLTTAMGCDGGGSIPFDQFEPTLLAAVWSASCAPVGVDAWNAREVQRSTVPWPHVVGAVAVTLNSIVCPGLIKIL